MKKIVYLLGFCILLFMVSSVNAVLFASNSTINTSVSNTSVIFDMNTTCDEAIIETINITLYNCTTTCFNSILFFNQTNHVNYSSTFCDDHTNPTVNLNSPTNGTVTNDNTPTFTFNFTDSDSGTANCSIVSNTINNDETYYYQTMPNEVNIHDNLTDGNINTGLIISNTYYLYYNKPENVSSVILQSTYDFYGTIETDYETLVGSCWGSNPILFKVTDGAIRCWAGTGWDGTVSYGAGNTIFDIAMNWTGTNITSTKIILARNSSVINNTNTNITTNNLPNGNYSTYINCTDNSSNVGFSSYVTFEVVTSPYVSITNPTNGSNTSSNNMNITYQLLGNATENVISYYNISLLNSDGSFNTTIQGNNSVNLSYYWSGVLSGYVLGAHKVRVDAINSSGSVFASGNITYTVVTNAVLNVSVVANGSSINSFYVNMSPGDSAITTTGSLVFDIIKNYTYTVSMNGSTHGGGVVSMNWSADVNYLVFNVTYNNLQIFFFSELNNSPIFDVVSVTLSSITNSYNGSSSSGNLTLMNIPPDTYQLLLSAPGYSSKNYEILIAMNNSNQVLNTSLIPNSSSTLFTINVQDSLNRVIPDARIIISRAYGGVWTVIADSYTDDGGVVYIPLESGTPYVVTIIAPGFLTKTFTFTFLAANNPYTFRLSSVSGTVYTDVFNDINYTYSPTNTLLVNGSNTFTLNVLSLGSLLEWVSINSSLNDSNLSGNPTILLASIVVDLVDEGGNTYSVTYCLKQSNYAAYCFTVNYYVEGRTPSNNSLTNSLETFRTSFSGGTSTGWLTLIAIVSILIICVIVSQLSGGNSMATTISGFAGMVVFAFIGWLNLIICGFVVVIGVALFFFNKSGGTG